MNSINKLALYTFNLFNLMKKELYTQYIILENIKKESLICSSNLLNKSKYIIRLKSINI